MHIIDRFTYYTLDFLNRHKAMLSRKDSDITLQDLYNSYKPALVRSHVGMNSTLDRYDMVLHLKLKQYRNIAKVRVSDFFASVLDIRTEIFRYALRVYLH